MSNEVNETQRQITIQQELVIVQLLAGQTQTVAAVEVGVAKETVTRWMTGDANFVAALNAGREELWRSNMDWLRTLADQAVATVGGLLEARSEAIRLKAALAILSMVRGLAQDIGSTDPEEVQLDWAEESTSDIEKICAGLV